MSDEKLKIDSTRYSQAQEEDRDSQGNSTSTIVNNKDEITLSIFLVKQQSEHRKKLFLFLLISCGSFYLVYLAFIITLGCKLLFAENWSLEQDSFPVLLLFSSSFIVSSVALWGMTKSVFCNPQEHKNEENINMLKEIKDLLVKIFESSPYK